MKATDRHKLIERIKTIYGLTDDERSALLGLLRASNTYELVWEDKPEDIEECLRNKLPVLIEDKERAWTDFGPHAPKHILIEGDNRESLATIIYAYAGKIDVIYKGSCVDSEDSYHHSKMALLYVSSMSRRLRIATKTSFGTRRYFHLH